MSLTTTYDRLVKTILSIHNADITESERMGFCRRRDEFLKSSPVRAECALLLTKHKSTLVRVFETLSYCVKFQFRHIDRTTLDEIKVEYYHLGSTGCYRDVTIDERNQLKIALIDLTVEVMKTEWRPALWKPSFFDIAKEEPAQTDLVLYTFLVLLPVIYKSDNLDVKNRLSDGLLRSGVKAIIGFLRDTIKRHNEQLSSSTLSSSSSEEKNKSDDNIIQTSFVQLLREFFRLILDLDFYVVNSTLVTLSVIFPNERFFISAAFNKIKRPNVQKFFVRNILITDLFERLCGFFVLKINQQQQQWKQDYLRIYSEHVINVHRMFKRSSI